MLPMELIKNRKLDIRAGNSFWKTQELIDYTKITQLPYLEIREAIDLFTGITEFNFIWKILPKEEKSHLRRDKVFYNGLSRKKDQIFKWKNNLYKDFLKMNPALNWSGECSIIEAVPGNYDYYHPQRDLYIYRPYEEFKSHNFQTELNLYFCKTEFLLHWALLNGILLSEKLQGEFKINQANIPKTPLNITEIRHTQIQATAQLLLTIEDSKSLSMKEIINRIEKLATEHKMRKHGSLEGPLETIYSENLYFTDTKYTVLCQLIKEVHPNPKGRGCPRKSPSYPKNPCSLKEIPGVFFHTTQPSLAFNYQKLGIVIQTLGYLLYGLKIISNQKEALSHPTIHHYIQTNSFLKQYARFCLNPVCPP